jgi:hypothetical protein
MRCCCRHYEFCERMITQWYFDIGSIIGETSSISTTSTIEQLIMNEASQPNSVPISLIQAMLDIERNGHANVQIYLFGFQSKPVSGSLLMRLSCQIDMMYKYRMRVRILQISWPNNYEIIPFDYWSNRASNSYNRYTIIM